MQRTRVKGAVSVKSGKWIQYERTWNSTKREWNNPTVGNNITVSASYGQTEIMTDIYRPAPSKRVYFEDVLPMSHDTFSMTLGKTSTAWYYVNSSKTIQRKNVYSVYGVSEAYARAQLPAFPALSSLPHREAADQFNAGGVGTEMSLANFLLELGEIKSLFTQLNPKRLYRAFQGKHGDKEISGGFLAYNFGIKPLINDLLAISAYTTNLQKRLEWLLENRGKVVSLDFRKTLSTKPTNTTVSGTASATSRTWMDYSLTYHAFCRWKVDYDPVRQALEKLRYFNRYFGLKKLLSVVWEAIPWSFVFDWVTNLGDLLTQFELPTTLRSNITAVGYSLKDQGRFQLRGHWYTAWNPGFTLLSSDVSFKRYRRYPGLPLSIQTAYDLSSATGRQQALAMALIHQRIR